MDAALQIAHKFALHNVNINEIIHQFMSYQRNLAVLLSKN